MPTRYRPGSRRNFGQAPLPTGYDAGDVPSGFSLPPVGIADVDTSLFYLFDREIPIQVTAPGPTGAAIIKDVPVVFAAGEKWAVIKRGGAPRDKQGTLILPIIAIGRKNISQTPNDDITGRGINQQGGEIIIRRRLDESDRGYQNLINRMLLVNQDNVAVSSGSAGIDQVSTIREVGGLSEDPTVQDGGLLYGNRRNSVWETIVIPAPQFYTAQYEVIIWTQYEIQMNQILEQLMSSFLPQGNAWRLDARDDQGVEKGYWFVATVDGNLYNSQHNYDDMSTQERVIKYQFNVNVPAYILASKTPGAPVPVRRYVSTPTIEFSIAAGVAEQTGEVGVDDPFLGSDDPTLPLNDDPTGTADQRRDGRTRLYPNRVSSEDPARLGLSRGADLSKYRRITGIDRRGRTVTRWVKIRTVNQSTGETVYASDTDLGGLKIIMIDR